MARTDVIDARGSRGLLETDTRAVRERGRHCIIVTLIFGGAAAALTTVVSALFRDRDITINTGAISGTVALVCAVCCCARFRPREENTQLLSSRVTG
jgi:hypothetical protein